MITPSYAGPESQWPLVAGPGQARLGPGSVSRLARAGEVWSRERGLLGSHELTTGGTALGAEARRGATSPGSQAHITQ